MKSLQEAQENFIREWGRMSSSWGINRTMAQIHALLFVTGIPHTMDEICERLGISRGNASMNLRNLNDWGVVRRFRVKGERYDRYVADADVLTMVARVARERKRRELDPTQNVIRDCLNILATEGNESEVVSFRRRLNDLLGLFELIDAVFRVTFATDEQFKSLIKQRENIQAILDEASQNKAKSRKIKW